MAVGTRIREARQQLDLTQEQLARKAGLNLRTIQKWEAGVSRPRIDLLAKAADALEKPVEWFLPSRMDAESADLIERVAMRMIHSARRETRYGTELPRKAAR